mmetsp:Transcript_85765/g.251113  ORF Transcript_85765/g.251113 Transcript_85765/m.251113 type:complete len:208 (+) Transcript_85765:639-1262(+)
MPGPAHCRTHGRRQCHHALVAENGEAHGNRCRFPAHDWLCRGVGRQLRKVRCGLYYHEQHESLACSQADDRDALEGCHVLNEGAGKEWHRNAQRPCIRREMCLRQKAGKVVTNIPDPGDGGAPVREQEREQGGGPAGAPQEGTDDVRVGPGLPAAGRTLLAARHAERGVRAQGHGDYEECQATPKSCTVNVVRHGHHSYAPVDLRQE